MQTVAAPTPAPPPATGALPPGAGKDWASAYESAAPGVERELIRLLAAHGGLDAPKVGAEGPHGIPIDISWPHRHIAVSVYAMPDEDRDDLNAAGWSVVAADPDAIIAALVGSPDDAATTERGEL